MIIFNDTFDNISAFITMITFLASCSFREVHRRPKLKSWFHRDPYKVRFLYQQIHNSLRTCSHSLSYTACTLPTLLVFSYQQRFTTLLRRDLNARYDWRRYSLRKGKVTRQVMQTLVSPSSAECISLQVVS